MTRKRQTSAPNTSITIKMTYPDTLYASMCALTPATGPLTATIKADICVIGAGLAGLTTALEAQRRGLEVVVLEAERVGWGASGRNAGIVSAGFSLGASQLLDAVGEQDAWTLHGLSATGAQYVRRQIERLKIPKTFHGEGFYRVSRRDCADEMQTDVERCGRKLGYELNYCERQQIQEILRTERYHQGIFDPNAFHIEPLSYALGLAKAFAALGGVILEQTKAKAIEKRENTWRVVTPEGAVDAGNVVLCTSAYDLSVYRPVTKAILPVATYVVAAKPASALLDTAIQTEAAVADTRLAGDYFRRLPGGRLVWGGRISTSRTAPFRIGERMLDDCYNIFMQLGDLKASHSWYGLMGYARHKMPLIGEVEPRLWYATAFGGHGLNTTAMAGHLIAGAISEGDDRYKLFESFKLKRAGGPFRRAITQGAYWAMQARDKISEIT
ncbi:MAG: FAD-binding oxidoreductase [Alphaproteobacteria bacterium]|nr:FAD-binding oxidoreductase [Alphaproteobacteria bacterium]